ncbi:MAG: D-alanyl-D-alanine carboxypeptidase [Firmicutes bacterium]|nr:D-alanyl-D-alanine carboxypeptidase [Bacillota bacterium]
MSCKVKRWCFVLVVLAVCLVPPRWGRAAKQLNISASSAILVDGATGVALWAKNPNWQRPIASLTKIMTAAIVLEYGDLDTFLTVSPTAARTSGSSMYLRAGAPYQVGDLLHGLMLLSGNDAATALAEHFGGSEEQFVAQMNKKAQMLGALDTNFVNPHGLPAQGHYSTAHDLAMITRYALANPEFAEVVASKQATVLDPASGGLHPIYSKNRLLWELEGADGVKTGYTLAAGRCLVASATRNGRQVIAVILDGPRMWEDAKALLTYGLEEYETQLVGKKGQVFGTVGVEGGIASTVTAVIAQDVWVTLPKAAPVEVEYILNGGLKAPLEEWAPLGTLMVKHGDEVIAETPLLAGQAVAARSWAGYVKHFAQRMKNLLAVESR